MRKIEAGRSMLGIAAVVAALAAMPDAGPSWPPREPPRLRKSKKTWRNEGVRANKQYRLKGIRP